MTPESGERCGGIIHRLPEPAINLAMTAGVSSGFCYNVKRCWWNVGGKAQSSPSLMVLNSTIMSGALKPALIIHHLMIHPISLCPAPCHAHTAEIGRRVLVLSHHSSLVHFNGPGLLWDAQFSGGPQTPGTRDQTSVDQSDLLAFVNIWKEGEIL